MSAACVILYHKHHTSARTRFLRLGHGGVCGLDGLPTGARIAAAETGDDDAPAATGRLLAHPAMLLRTLEERLGLARGSLERDAGFRCRVFAEDGASDVYLAHFTSVDPPFAAADAAGAGFIDLTQARGLPAVELQLLRLAYEHVLG